MPHVTANTGSGHLNNGPAADIHLHRDPLKGYSGAIAVKEARGTSKA
ncbi:hypothetical protein GALL_467880 [mine drainage metagenome]|uniref:Uncharacterized protein n=1 Tax=mine drainage metagenome TaxID=410659 RepID=A0A1J5PKA1_9ZZZZ